MSRLHCKALLLGVLIAPLLVGTAASAGPSPPPDVRVSALPLSRAVLATLPNVPARKPPAIAAIAEDQGKLMVATPSAVFWLDQGGTEVQRTTLPRRLGHVRVARLREGGRPVVVGALDSVGKHLLVVPAEGGPSTLRLDGYRAALTDVLDDQAFEVVVSKGASFLVYDQRGRLLRTVAASDYIWDFVALEANGRPKDELLAYLYQNPKDGTFIELVDGDGERIRTWHEPKANRYSVSEWSAPAPSVVAVLDDVVTERSPRGEVLRQFRVEGLGSYKQARTGVLRDGVRLILVTSGSCAARLLAFDSSGTLVYDEVYPSYAALHVPSPGAAEFFVGVGASVYRYHLGGVAGAK